MSPSKTLRHYRGSPYGSPNSGHTVRAYALTQMPRYARHFVCLQPLYEIRLGGLTIEGRFKSIERFTV